MASGTKRQLCAVLVLRCRGTRIRQSGTVELVICVLTATKCPQKHEKNKKWKKQHKNRKINFFKKRKEKEAGLQRENARDG